MPWAAWLQESEGGVRMAAKTLAGGTFALGGDLTVTRMGYGAMQLAGPYVFGPPADRDAAVAVLREAVDLGITHIDTADFYGPHVTNQIIREALHPYPADLHIVTKVGSVRDADGGWPRARAPEQLRAQVHDNLDNLGLDALDVVNMRVGGLESPEPGSIAEPFAALAQLQQDGLIKHLGISTASAEQVAEAQAIAPVACVQNYYNIAQGRR
jgi:aryl-alcohol dehydrogenase-like predicted oxidoreductase